MFEIFNDGKLFKGVVSTVALLVMRSLHLLHNALPLGDESLHNTLLLGHMKVAVQMNYKYHPQVMFYVKQ